MAPMVLAVVLEIIDFAQAHDSRTPWTKRAWKIMSHFPGIQLKQHWDFLQELSTAANHMMNLAEFKTQILDVINCHPELENSTKWDKYSVTRELEDELSGSDMEKLQYLMMMSQKGINGAFTGSASNELKEIIAKEQKRAEERMSEIQMRVQEFKVSVPKVIFLQAPEFNG